MDVNIHYNRLFVASHRVFSPWVWKLSWQLWNLHPCIIIDFSNWVKIIIYFLHHISSTKHCITTIPAGHAVSLWVVYLPPAAALGASLEWKQTWQQLALFKYLHEGVQPVSTILFISYSFISKVCTIWPISSSSTSIYVTALVRTLSSLLLW